MNHRRIIILIKRNSNKYVHFKWKLQKEDNNLEWVMRQKKWTIMTTSSKKVKIKSMRMITFGILLTENVKNSDTFNMEKNFMHS
jgi:hypothetical protein